MKKNRNRKKQLGIIAVTIAVTLLSAAFLSLYLVKLYESKKEYQNWLAEINQEQAEKRAKYEAAIAKEMARLAEAEKAAKEAEAAKRPEASWAGKHDFEELQESNPDIYAWLSVPDFEIEYPVLQHKKDDYYLNRNLDGSSGYPGCIYTNSCNKQDFSDLNTIVYGHNMKNGTMFGSLSDIVEKDLSESGYVYIYTPEKRFTYMIYAAVEFADIYIPDTYGVRSKEGLKSFLKAVNKSAKYYKHPEMEVTADDRVLTLSTCIGGRDTRRYLLIAKLEEEETVQEDLAQNKISDF